VPSLTAQPATDSAEHAAQVAAVEHRHDTAKHGKRANPASTATPAFGQRTRNLKQLGHAESSRSAGCGTCQPGAEGTPDPAQRDRAPGRAHGGQQG
jgi:hypothetical protein